MLATRSRWFPTLFALIAGCSSTSTTPPGERPPPPGRFEAALATPLRYPARLALGPDGTIYVSDPVAGRVFGYAGGKRSVELAGLDQPLGLAVAGTRLLVGNAGARGSVEVYDLAARAGLFSLGQGEGEVGLPNAIAVAPDGRVHVADSKAGVVKVYAPDGALAERVGKPGSGDGELRFPAAVAVDAARIVVGDQGNHRVQLFDRAGRWQRSIGGEAPEKAATLADYRGRFTRVQGVALDGERIYVLDSVHGHVQLLDVGGAAKGFLGQRGDCASCTRLPFDVALGGRGKLLVSDPEHGRWIEVPR
jgi:DNA-binding beta-propeller fold protein YncE